MATQDKTSPPLSRSSSEERGFVVPIKNSVTEPQDYKEGNKVFHDKKIWEVIKKPAWNKTKKTWEYTLQLEGGTEVKVVEQKNIDDVIVDDESEDD